MIEELNKIDAPKVMVLLGGEERELRFAFKAWKEIEKHYGTIQKMGPEVNEHPFENLPFLLFQGLRKKEGVTEEMVEDWIDELTGIEMVDLLNKVKEGMQLSTPDTPKGGSTKNRKQAKKIKDGRGFTYSRLVLRNLAKAKNGSGIALRGALQP